jgi:hypothetical protein
MIGMNTILFMAGTAVATAVSEKVANAFGKQELGQFIAISGLGLLGLIAVKSVKDLLVGCKTLI